ncbi:MAG: aldehyde dehydrogenase family protein [Planctomycetia bacterium]|nr:aldehyde dehydrogenase family protein [Planctomycetia bacterium]
MIDRCLDDLADGKSRWRETPLERRIDLARACLEGAIATADRWVAEACRAKGIEPDTPLEAEETAAGPMATVRYLALLVRSLEDVKREGRPRLPGRVATTANGQLAVQVFPTRGMFDSVLFRGFRADVWMQPGVTRENLPEHVARTVRPGAAEPGIALVLGAGNVSSIAPTDAFSKLFQEGKVVLLKMNPVNEYLGGIFAQAFAPLIEEGFLRIIYGGAEAGTYAVEHPQVDEVHITGSVYSHETIVWGPPGAERDRRKAESAPRLRKRITSELGNVTPWIVVPGPYSDRELDFQAENVAAMIANNASFNCIATKMIVTARNWPDRERFLDKIEAVLARIPRRRAYYPGALERFTRFTGRRPDEGPAGTLPWTLLRDARPESDPHLFDEESFVCVCAETALDAASPEEFLRRAPDFVNDRLWGNLGAGLMIHPKTRRQPGGEASLQDAIARLRFGTVGINHWPAISYALMCTPWGGFPEGTLADPKSGLGWVHNTYLLDAAQKTVLEGPLTMSPKPFWFPTHRTAHVLARKTIELVHRPSVWKLPALMLPALRG